MEVLSQFIGIVLIGIVGLVVPVVASAIYRWLLAKAEELKNSTSEEQLYQFTALVKMVVHAAEQSGLVGLIEDKKQYAIDTLQAIVDARGWKIPVAQIEAEIEAAIHQGLEMVETEEAEDATTGGTVNITVDNKTTDLTNTPSLGTPIDAELAQQ